MERGLGMESGVSRVRWHLHTVSKSLGIDLICNTCQHHVPRSQQLEIIEGIIKDPRIRKKWLTNCPNCHDGWQLLPCFDPDDPYKLCVYAGATEQHFSAAAENVPTSSEDK